MLGCFLYIRCYNMNVSEAHGMQGNDNKRFSKMQEFSCCAPQKVEKESILERASTAREILFYSKRKAFKRLLFI